jgi:hypothetical protein
MRPALIATVAAVLLGACGVDTIPSGLRKTPEGNGPTVKFDTAHRPLPEVPLPNDVATFADPTSRTGRRINVSLVAPTSMERRAREDFAVMEGWGVSSPISVAFERPDDVPETEPAIDLDDVAVRMQRGDHDFSDDPVYVVNLSTGLPDFLDGGTGYYPVTVRDPFRYFPNDPKASEGNTVFETIEEGAGLPQSAYRPELDRDFDGVLDHPNVRTRRPDEILTWYERETDTLMLRPLVPLDEKTEYAVVLTDRLRGANGEPVKSPFEAIHHPTQRRGIARLSDWLIDKRLANYYGDIAGTGLEHVAFAWTFTTQPTHEDMRLLRDGLYGKGPFSRFAKDFPPEITAKRAAGTAPANEDQPEGWQNSSDACRARAKAPFVLKTSDPDIRASLRDVIGQVFGVSKGELEALDRTIDHIDHVVVGSFKSPYLMGDPASRDPDTRFHLDFRTGGGDVTSDDVSFLLVVPKAKGDRKQPFPVTMWGHGVTGNSTEAILFGGDFARQGIATLSYNAPGHGLVVSDAQRTIATNVFRQSCVQPFFGGLEGGRAHDINGDGAKDSGWFWWTSHIFHTRDNVRQAILDGMNLVRILRTFDGRRGAQDLDDDGVPDTAGDFDLDGVPDIGGPKAPYYASGRSLGGILSEIQGGIDPYVVAAAPVSGAGTLAMDVALRSYGVVESVTSQMLGPLVFSLPAGERPDKGDDDSVETPGSKCGKDQRTVRIVVNEGVVNNELELACLNADELQPNMTVIVTNVTSGEARCARTEKDGRFRVPIPTSAGDRLDIQVYTAPDVVQSYGDCHLYQETSRFVGRRVNTFEQPAAHLHDVADSDTNECVAPEGCQQFRDRFFVVGDPLVAPNEGLGLRRQSPQLRRFRDLAQAALDPADPQTFAPYYMLKALRDENGDRVAPHALLNINTVGDNFVQVSGGVGFARAAGAVPFLPPTALERLPEYADYVTPPELYERLGRKTPMQALIDNGVIEGIARLGRTSAGPTCRANYKKDGTLCTSDPTIDPLECRNALFDPDWLSEGRLPIDQPHPDTPHRLARVAKVRVTDSQSLAAAWEPRLRGVPFGPDESGWSATERVVGLLDHYLTPKGSHTWSQGDLCKQWDYATYGNALIARFFASEGKDVYYLSHPKTHTCLADGTCDFFK